MYAIIFFVALMLVYVAWRWYQWKSAVRHYSTATPGKKFLSWHAWEKSDAPVGTRKPEVTLTPAAAAACSPTVLALRAQLRDAPSSPSEWSISINPAAAAAGLGAMTDGAFVGIIAAEAFAHVDSDFLSAIQFSTAEHLNNLHSIDSYVQEHFFHSASSSAEGWLHRLEGYVAEQKAAIALEKAGDVVQFAPSASQPAWDFLVDGRPWQVKEGIDVGGIKDALAHHPDIPIVTGADLAGQIHDPMVHGLHAVDHHAIAATTKESLVGLKDGFHPGVKIPVVTIALSSWREFNLLIDDKTTLERALKSVAIDTVGVGAGMVAGAKLGALAGSWAGPVGSAIGAFLFGVGGALLGRMGSHAYRFKDFNRAYESYQSRYNEAQGAVYQKIDDSKNQVRRLGTVYQQRFLRARSVIESRARMELQRLSALRAAELGNFTSRFPEYLGDLIEQLAQEEILVLGKKSQPRWWGWIFPGPIELERGIIRRWFAKTRECVQQEKERYVLLAESDRQGRLAKASYFLSEYCFELQSLQRHLNGLNEKFKAMQDEGERIKACAIEEANATGNRLLRELGEGVASIRDDVAQLIRYWSEGLRGSREWVRREAEPLGVWIPD